MSQTPPRAAVPLGDDTAMNMTPMIDVCFQLIVFFMLTMRFPSVAQRFECQLPKDRGPTADPRPIRPFQDIEVRLFRENLDRAPEERFTRIRVGESYTVSLPKGPWPQGGAEEDARRRATEEVVAQVAGAVAAAWARQNNSPEVGGAIRTPPPKGEAVPHGDVMHVMDAFVAAGITKVHLEGAKPPTGGPWRFH